MKVMHQQASAEKIGENLACPKYWQGPNYKPRQKKGLGRGLFVGIRNFGSEPPIGQRTRCWPFLCQEGSENDREP